MERECLINSRRDAILGTVPYSAIKSFDAELLFSAFGMDKLKHFGRATGQNVFSAIANGKEVLFLYTDLAWDTNYFGFRSIRLMVVLFNSDIPVAALTTATHSFINELREQGVIYCYSEVAANDPALLVALGANGWSLVETRLHYYQNSLAQHSEHRYPVRAATTEQDAGTVRSVAADNRNLFDRFHADPAFTLAQADAFLGEYAAASVKGYCDKVLVPSQVPVDSFLAVSHLQEDADLLGVNLGRVVLTAVGPNNRGWHRKLVSETLHYTREREGEIVFMTTQATNRAVIHNSEYLGFKLGGTTHILSVSLDVNNFKSNQIILN
jgi:dTDP-4-amino-4,6-dideoxy-D-galactose acyltransferase